MKLKEEKALSKTEERVLALLQNFFGRG